MRPVNDGPAALGTMPQQSLEEGGEPARIGSGDASGTETAPNDRMP